MSAPQLRVATPTAGLAEGIADLAETVVWDMVEPAPAGDFDVVVPPYMSRPELLGALAGVNVRMVQSQSIGYDGVVDHLPAGVLFCNAEGVHESSTAELTIGLIIASLRGFGDFVRAQARGEWVHARHDALADKRVLVVGYGGVGRAIAGRLEPFEVTITPVASRRREEAGRVVHGLDELADLLPISDVVVLAVPLNDATTGMVDERFLAAMKPGALLVNVARGPVVNTDALVAAVRSRGLRAALDVTDPEPLPPKHPLWRLDGVLITPHVGGHSTAMEPRIVALLRDQLDRLRSGAALRNVVIGAESAGKE